VLIVFCVELVALNVDSGKGGDEGTQVSESPPTGDEVDDGGQEEPDTDNPGEKEQPGDGNLAEDGDQNGEEHQPLESKPYELLMYDDVHTLMLEVSEELFEYSSGADGWWFTHKGNGEARFQIVPHLITPPGGMTELVETLLIPYLDGGESSVGREMKIANSTLRGIYVTGENNGEIYEAWVYGLEVEGNSGRAVDFIINYQNEGQKEALYAILDTLDMVTEGTEPIEPEE